MDEVISLRKLTGGNQRERHIMKTVYRDPAIKSTEELDWNPPPPHIPHHFCDEGKNHAALTSSTALTAAKEATAALTTCRRVNKPPLPPLPTW
jgi:hypothetical protein